MSAFLVGQPMTRPASSESEGLGITVSTSRRVSGCGGTSENKRERRTVEVDVLRTTLGEKGQLDGVSRKDRPRREMHARRQPGVRCGHCSAEHGKSASATVGNYDEAEASGAASASARSRTTALTHLEDVVVLDALGDRNLLERGENLAEVLVGEVV